MRETLYRGRRKDNGELIYGDLLHNSAGLKIRQQETAINGVAKSYEVIPESVGEYIGIDDKKGNKIFTGDIIEYTKDYCRYEIVFAIEDGVAKFCAKDIIDGKSLYYINTSKDKVIGNKYDNPELLEG